MSTSRAARSLLVLPARSGVTPACSRPAVKALSQPKVNRNLSTSSPICAEEGTKQKGLFKSLLHGSDSAKKDGMTAQSHSQQVGRGKYIHEIQRHVVRPDKVDDYVNLLADYYPRLAAEQSVPCRLVGSWQVSVGELETFCKLLVNSMSCMSIAALTLFLPQTTSGSTMAIMATMLVTLLCKHPR